MRKSSSGKEKLKILLVGETRDVWNSNNDGKDGGTLLENRFCIGFASETDSTWESFIVSFVRDEMVDFWYLLLRDFDRDFLSEFTRYRGRGRFQVG